jgi:pyruvate dehydrogenase E2 component (dihydrolipoamide acetyltransferase)
MKMVMPKMGMTMEEGTIVEWKKKEGDYVKKGEIILEIMTNKVNIDVEAPESGYLHILKRIDETVPVNEPIAIIEKSTEEKIKELVEIPVGTEEKKEDEHAVPEMRAEPMTMGSGTVLASPRAKVLAEKENISLKKIMGTGPEGAITEKDVLQALDKGKIEKAEIEEKGEMEVKEEKPPKITAEKEEPPHTTPLNVSPLAERIAADKGIDLSLIEGTGIGGKITKDDVLSYLETHKPVKPPEEPEKKESEAREHEEEVEIPEKEKEITEEIPEKEKEITEEIPEKEKEMEIEREEIPVSEKIVKKEEMIEEIPVPQETPLTPPPRGLPPELPQGQSIPLKGIRKLTAERMIKSKTEAPHLTLGMEADMTEAVKLKKSLPVTYTDILIKAVALALKAHPIMNSTVSGNTIIIREEINIGFAVARDEDLLVPVVHDADTHTLKEIAKITEDLIQRTLDDQLTDKDVLDGTFTISNLGMYDIDFFTPIINPPEAAILGVGIIQKKPVVRDDVIEIRDRITLSLSFDHRIVNGMPAALFLREIKTLLEHPYRLLVEEES